MKYDDVCIIVVEIHQVHDKSPDIAPLSQFVYTHFNRGLENK